MITWPFDVLPSRLCGWSLSASRTVCTVEGVSIRKRLPLSLSHSGPASLHSERLRLPPVPIFSYCHAYPPSILDTIDVTGVV